MQKHNLYHVIQNTHKTGERIQAHELFSLDRQVDEAIGMLRFPCSSFTKQYAEELMEEVAERLCQCGKHKLAREYVSKYLDPSTYEC